MMGARTAGHCRGRLSNGLFYARSHRGGQNKAEQEHMPKLTVEAFGTFDAPHGKRLVLALEDEAGVDQLHACGGNCRCTTCRVEFIAGEPERMTEAEKAKLAERGLSGVRLSCQILLTHDIIVRAISRFEGSGRVDPGPRPEPDIHPTPVWTTK
jgi:ferredoxin